MTEQEKKDMKEFLEIVTSVIKETKGVVFDINTLTIRNINDIKQEERNKAMGQFLNSLWTEEWKMRNDCESCCGELKKWINDEVNINVWNSNEKTGNTNTKGAYN